jgi:hypothetical protein
MDVRMKMAAPAQATMRKDGGAKICTVEMIGNERRNRHHIPPTS